jgi:anti-sigma regulatory factor (Ser/Thr protein kinase)
MSTEATILLCAGVWLAVIVVFVAAVSRLNRLAGDEGPVEWRVRELELLGPEPDSVCDSISIRLPGGPAAPAAARRAVGARLTGPHRAIAHDVVLLVSELVTNSVVHGQTGADDRIGINLRMTADDLRVDVANRRRPFAPSEAGDGGRGLQIVEALADRWGLEQGDQTRLWFVVSHDAGGDPAPASGGGRVRRLFRGDVDDDVRLPADDLAAARV